MTRALAVIFCRVPRPGEVKTRLVPVLGADGAALLYDAFLRDCVAATRASGTPVALAITPREARSWFSRAFPGLPLQVQEGADLGERLRRCFREVHAQGHREVIIMGSDCPTWPPHERRLTFEALRHAPVALGPDRDGGLHALGVLPGTDLTWLDGVSWSEPSVLAELCDRLHRLGLPWATTTSWFDVDSPADLALLTEGLRQPHGYPAPHTRRALIRLGIYRDPDRS